MKLIAIKDWSIAPLRRHSNKRTWSEKLRKLCGMANTLECEECRSNVGPPTREKKKDREELLHSE